MMKRLGILAKSKEFVTLGLASEAAENYSTATTTPAERLLS